MRYCRGVRSFQHYDCSAETLPRSARIREKYWQLRHWLSAVRTVLPKTSGRAVRPADVGAWLDEAHLSGETDLRGKRVLVFTYLHYWLDFMAAVSAGLVARGADVTYAWLPYATFDGENDDSDDRIIALYAPILSKPRARFRSINLTELPADLAPVTNQLKRLARLDTQCITPSAGGIGIEEADRAMYEFRLHRLRLAHGTVSRIVRSGSYDNVLVPSGGVLEFAAAWQAAAEAGADTVTIETWEKRQTCAIGFGRPVFSDTAKEELWHADSKVLDEARRARVAENMRIRESPVWDGHVYSLQNAGVTGGEELRRNCGSTIGGPSLWFVPMFPTTPHSLGW